MTFNVRLITAQNNATVFTTEAADSNSAQANAKRFYPGCRIQTVTPVKGSQ